MTQLSKPLAGRRICITRARQQAGSLAESLQALGAEVIAAPMIEIVPPDSYAPLDDALVNLARYDWLVLTSANGVAAMHARMQTLAIEKPTLQIPKIIAIGPATAMTLKKHGWAVSAMPTEYVAESVVEALREEILGKCVLLIRAKVARDVIPDELQRLGAQVDVIEAYQTVIPADASERLRAIFVASAMELPEAITFTSSSTVKHFFHLLRAAGLELPKGMVVASIGPITTDTLREHGVAPDIEAQAHTIPGLVEAITTYWQDRGPVDMMPR